MVPTWDSRVDNTHDSAYACRTEVKLQGRQLKLGAQFRQLGVIESGSLHVSCHSGAFQQRNVEGRFRLCLQVKQFRSSDALPSAKSQYM